MTLQRDQTSDFVAKYRAGRITRRQLLHSLGVIGALGVAQSLAPGLVRPAMAQGAPKRGGTLVAATIDKPVNLDPAFAELYSSMQVYQNVFSKLVYVDADGSLIPGLAKAWRQLDDTTWEFDLVDNAWFHNDEKMTAQDVKFTFDRLADPELGAANLVFVRPLEGVEVIDDTTVRFHTQPNWGGLLTALAAVSDVVNRRAIEEHDPRLTPIGTGPFRFVEWVKDDHITLERWDKYWKEGHPYLDRVIFRAISDDTVRLTGLQTGEFGWIEQVPLHRVEELRQDPELKANSDGQFFPDMFLLNTTIEPFDKLEVRQALQWAMSREAIAQIVWHGQAVPSMEPVAPGNVWHSGVDQYAGAPDLAKARAALEQAGYGDGLTIGFASQPQVPTQPLVGQLMQQQLRQIGINLEVQSFESARWFEELLTKRYQLTSTYWSATVDPVEHCLGPLSRSGSPWNFTGIASPELDAAIDAYTFTVDPEARKTAYADVIRVHQEQAPMIFQVNFTRTYWTRPEVQGVQTLPSLELRMEDVWIEG